MSALVHDIPPAKDQRFLTNLLRESKCMYHVNVYTNGYNENKLEHEIRHYS